MIRRFPNPTVTATDNGCLCLPEDRIKSRNQSVTSETGEEAGFVFAGEFMAPDAHHTPAGAAEGAGDEPVAGDVAGDLLPPEFRVGRGLRGVERTPVPSDFFAETPPVFVHNRAVRKHHHWNHVFLHRDRIVKITLPIDKFPQAHHHKIRDFTLRFHLGHKNTWHVFVFPHRQRRPLKEGIRVDTESVASRIDFTHDGLIHLARF